MNDAIVCKICDDVLFHIFEYVDPDEIVNVSVISKQFHYICSDDFLWLTYYKFCEDYHNKNLNNLSNKDAYKICHNVSLIKRELKIDKSMDNILKMRNLISGSKRVTKIPKEIAQLYMHLQKLYLSDNEITIIPHEIGLLFNLQELYLSNNKITKIPEQLLQLINLRELNLSCNNITKVSKELIQFVGLELLDVSFNKLTEISISKGITKRINWRSLKFIGNEITEIPSEIRIYISSQELHMFDNKIKAIPRFCTLEWRMGNIMIDNATVNINYNTFV